MSTSFSKIFKGLGLTAATAALIKFGKSAINAASELEEIQNVVNVAFGDAAGKIDTFAKNCINRFGLSEKAAKSLASTFMYMANGIGVSTDKAQTMAIQLTGLAGDLASFNDTSVEAAQTALEGIYTGNWRALKQYGIVLTEATLQEYAYSQGIRKKISAMSEAEKVTLRYNYVLSVTKQQQNDFVRTTNSWANQVRLLAQQFNILKVSVGQLLAKALLPVIKALNYIIAYLNAAIRVIKKVFFGIDDTNNAIGKATGGTIDLGDAAGDVASGFDDAAKAAKKLDNLISGFDELNILQVPSDTSGSGGGGINPYGGGFDVGTYFDPDDIALPTIDTSKFEEAFTSMLETIKEKFDELTLALTNNTNTIQGLFNWKNLLGIAGLVAAISLIPKLVDWEYLFGGIKNLFISGEWSKIPHWIAIQLGVAKDVIDGWIIKLSKTFSPLGKIFKSVGKLISTWLIGPIKLLGSVAGTVFGAIWDLLKPVVSTLLKPITAGLQALWNILQPLISKLLAPLQPLLTKITGAFQGLWGVIAAHPIAALVAAIALAIASVVNWAKQNEEFRARLWELWVNVLRPVVDYVKEQAQVVWNNVLKPLWEKLKGLVSSVIELVQSVWNKISEFIAWFTYYILPPIWMVAGEIIAAATRILGNIGEIVGGIITAITGIIKFLTGVFTGDWKKAWEGIKSVFKGIWDSLVGVAKGPINLVIGLINTFLGVVEGVLNAVGRAVNKLSIKIPDWVPGFGGRTYGFNISTVSLTRIPYLAQGGVITDPTMAMIGEYAGAQRNPEIVTPTNLMREVIAEGNDDLVDVIIQIGQQVVEAINNNETVITIGDDVISAAAARGAKNYKYRTGRNQFAV